VASATAALVDVLLGTQEELLSTEGSIPNARSLWPLCGLGPPTPPYHAL